MSLSFFSSKPYVVVTHENRLDKTILLSTHNIRFDVELFVSIYLSSLPVANLSDAQENG